MRGRSLVLVVFVVVALTLVPLATAGYHPCYPVCVPVAPHEAEHAIEQLLSVWPPV